MPADGSARPVQVTVRLAVEGLDDLVYVVDARCLGGSSECVRPCGVDIAVSGLG